MRRGKYESAKEKIKKFNESREAFSVIRHQMAEERLKLLQIEKD